MTIRSHIETAEEALRQALINSLAEKQDAQLTELFDALGKVKSILNAYPIRVTDNTSDYKFKLTSEYLDSGYINYNLSQNDNVISFSNVRGGMSDDILKL
jgi:methyltransferase-like protein